MQAPSAALGGTQGWVLAGVQFFFTLGWTVYVIYLPELLRSAGIAPRWLPWLLMADQLLFAAMDIALGIFADRVGEVFRRLGRLLLVLTTLSVAAFLLLPLLAPVSPLVLLGLLAIWVLSAAVLRGPTLVLLTKRARAAQHGQLVMAYAAGMALALALAPFLGLWLKGVDPRLPFALSGLALLAAVSVLLRLANGSLPSSAGDSTRPIAFAAYLPLLLVLGLAAFGFQVHAFVKAAPLYLAQAAREMLPWLMPLLWIGFAAALPVVGALARRAGGLVVAVGGLLLAGLGSYGAALADGLNLLIAMQILTGAGWALAFAGLMEQASVFGSRGAEGLFMGSFLAVSALAALARIGCAGDLAQVAPGWPAALLLAAGLLAAVYAFKRRKSPSAPGPG